eukprot:1159927-Pelagomonas_calceolata.AAC.7
MLCCTQRQQKGKESKTNAGSTLLKSKHPPGRDKLPYQWVGPGGSASPGGGPELGLATPGRHPPPPLGEPPQGGPRGGSTVVGAHFKYKEKQVVVKKRNGFCLEAAIAAQDHTLAGTHARTASHMTCT